jgi:hypothetical protein
LPKVEEASLEVIELVVNNYYITDEQLGEVVRNMFTVK